MSIISKLFRLGRYPELDSDDTLEEAVNRHYRIFRGSRGYGFLDWDLETKKMHWHGGFWSHLGYEDSDMSRISSTEYFMEFVYPSDRHEFSTQLTDLIKNTSDKDLILRLKRKTGEYIWAEVRVDVVRRADGRVSYMSGVIFDVTALKQTEEALMASEARHSRIIHASNDGVWEWSADEAEANKIKRALGDRDIDWRLDKDGFHFSFRCLEHLGYSSDDAVFDGQDERLVGWRDRIQDEDGRRFDKMLEDHIAGKCPFDIEYRIRGKNDEWRWIRTRGQMSYDKGGKPSAMSGANIDITELKRAEERVRRAKEQAEQANRAKSEFLSGMSHELRTPLNAILGFAQLFQLDDNLTATQKENIGEIQSAGKHLLGLIGDVLDLAKIEAGHMNFDIEKVCPSRIVKECQNLLKSQVDQRGISLTCKFGELENQVILADAMRLKQVFINLVSNAIKYNKDNGRIDVVFSQTLKGEMRISVADTGIGIPATAQKNLFQPFNRLGAERSAVEGSGVGLVITKQLVEQMGGEIGFSSEDGEGTRFWVTFPLNGKQGASDAEVSVEAKKLSGAVEVSQPEFPELKTKLRKKILYVEDNPSNQKLMTQLLAKFPVLDLDVVGQAVKGLYMARTARPDLIILDINLPGMNGYETVAVLKEDPITADIPVIALSANVLSHDIEKGKTAGFDEYLTKPVNLAQLIDACNKFLK